MLFIDHEEILKKSINSGYNMKFDEFVKYNKINLNEIFVDNLFHNIQNNLPIYIDENKIGYFGYKGSLSKQKDLICNILKDYFIGHKDKLYFELNNIQYLEFKKEKEKMLVSFQKDTNKIYELYPSILITRGKSTTKHLIITPRLFKELLMLCNTEKGKQVRKYYMTSFN